MIQLTRDESADLTWQYIASEVVALPIVAVGISVSVLAAGIISNRLSLLFYGVPIGGTLPFDGIQLWEPILALSILIAYVIVAIVGVTLSWRAGQQYAFEVIDRAV